MHAEQKSMHCLSAIITVLYFLFRKKRLASTALENTQETLKGSDYKVNFFFERCKPKLLRIRTITRSPLFCKNKCTRIYFCKECVQHTFIRVQREIMGLMSDKPYTQVSARRIHTLLSER